MICEQSLIEEIKMKGYERIEDDAKEKANQEFSELSFIYLAMEAKLRDELGDEVGDWVSGMSEAGKKILSRCIRGGWKYHAIEGDIMTLKAAKPDKTIVMTVDKDGNWKRK